MSIIVNDCEVEKSKEEDVEAGMRRSLGQLSLKLAEAELQAWCNYAKSQTTKEEKNKGRKK